MPKKASTERGYMTKKEIYSHLDGLKTNKGKVQYLDKILEKEKLLSPKTKESVYETLMDTYMKEKEWEVAEGLAEKLGKKGKEKLLEGYMKDEKWDGAEELAKKIGDKDEILAEIYEETGKVIKAKDLRRRLERQAKQKK